MGCCSSSNSTSQVKEPEKVSIHKDEYVEDEKEGEKRSQRAHNSPVINKEPNNKPISPVPNSAKEKAPEDAMSRQSSRIDLSANIRTNPRENIIATKQEQGENKEKNKFLEPSIKSPNQNRSPESPSLFKEKSVIQINGINHLSINGATEGREIKEERIEIKTYETRNRFQSDESTFKINREQHEELLKFVTEKKRNVQNGLEVLYQNLAKNLKEDDKLAFIIEDLKCWNRDIENSLDDVMTYWFENDYEFKMEIMRNSELMRNVVFEFGTLKKNLTPYKEFRDKMLIVLKDFDANVANRGLLSYRSTRGYSANKRDELIQASLAFIPREETQENEDHHRNMVEDQFDLRLEIK